MQISTLVLLFAVQSSLAIELNWLPADPDGPLPLSSKYRKSLQSLCKLIKSGSTLSSDVEEKRDVLVKLCAKLDAAEAVSETDYASPLGGYRITKKLLFIAAGVLFGAVGLLRTYQIFMSRRRSVGGAKTVGRSATINDVRNARLKKLS